MYHIPLQHKFHRGSFFYTFNKCFANKTSLAKRSSLLVISMEYIEYVYFDKYCEQHPQRSIIFSQSWVAEYLPLWTSTLLNIYRPVSRGIFHCIAFPPPLAGHRGHPREYRYIFYEAVSFTLVRLHKNWESGWKCRVRLELPSQGWTVRNWFYNSLFVQNISEMRYQIVQLFYFHAERREFDVGPEEKCFPKISRR